MRHIFRARDYFTVPDGTEVSAFLTATDSMQNNVPWGALGDMSIAAGRIAAGVSSAVHLHPIVTQVTYVVAGRLTVRMLDESSAEPYDLDLGPGDAVLTRPRTLFQLRNQSADVAEVLYVVSPAYVFETREGQIMYDDAVVLAPSWEALPTEMPAISTEEVRVARAEALRRLELARSPGPPVGH